ncbi:unnamed protein product [Anisakis simplex]|uniref:EGF-like domain-containing protein n=1 Tax=Anisakis simplex TaxID=6269 RepID=A0A0M3JYC8_ANISI|nr:unnamed protein product [Anisakis simplex]
MCIRKDAEEVIVNMLCDNDCLIDDLNALYQNSPHPNVQIRIFELERSACEQPELNDCDSNAECLANNLRYRCICKNDTSSDTTNRSSCNHTAVIPLAAGCFQLFGFCIIFWVMLVLLLLVLLILFLCCAIHRFHHRHQKSTSASENYTANILTVEERRQSSSGSRMINEEKMVQKTSESPINLKDCSELKKVEELKSDNVEIPKRNVDDANITAKCDSNSSMKRLPTSSDPKLINDPKQRQQQSEEKVDLNSVDEKAVPEDTSRCSSASTPSDSSTPTIWDTFKILGMQYTKRQSIKSQKSCSASLDELIRMRQEEQQQQAFSNDVRTPHNGAQSARLLQNQSADDRSNHMLNLTHTNTNSTNIPSSNGSTPKQESKVSDETTSIVDSSSLMRNTDEVSSKLYQISTAENISEQEQKDNNKSECCESGVRDEEEVVEKRKENEKKGTNDEMQLAIMKRRTPSKDSVLSKLNEVVEKAATLNNNGCQAERVRNGQPIIDNKNKRVDENGKSHHEIDNEAMVRDAKSKMVAKDLTEDEHTLVGANGYCRDRNEPALCTTRMVAGSCVNELLDLVEDSERKELNMAKFDATIKSSERYPTSGREIHSEHGKRTTRRTNKQQQRQHQVSVEQLPQSIATIHEEGISATCAEEKTTANDRGSASCETLLNAPIAATLSPDVNVTVNSDENAAKRLHQGDGDRFIVDHYYRRRYETPERKLSSISEKSAELVNDDDSCTSKSCPATTRVCNHRHTPELKRRFERKFSGYILDERANKAPKNGTRTDELDAEYFRQLPNILSKFRAKPHEDSDGSILEQNKAVLDDSTINSNDQSAKMQPNDSDSIKSIGEQQTNALIQTSGECFTDCKNADKIDEVDEKNSVGGQQTAIPRRAVSRARSRSREGDIRLGSERGRGTRLSCGSEGWRDEGDKEECVNRTCESENGLFKKNASSKRRLSDDKQQHATAIRRKIASRRRESSNLSAISDGACNELRSTNSSIADSDKISLESQKPPWNSSPLREGELDVIAPIKNFIFKTEPDSIQTSLATIQSRSPKQSQRSAVTLPSLSTSPFTTLHQHHLRDRSLSLANVKSKSPRDNRDIWPIRSVVDRLQSNTSLDQPLVKENLWWAHH